MVIEKPSLPGAREYSTPAPSFPLIPPKEETLRSTGEIHSPVAQAHQTTET